MLPTSQQSHCQGGWLRSVERWPHGQGYPRLCLWRRSTCSQRLAGPLPSAGAALAQALGLPGRCLGPGDQDAGGGREGAGGSCASQPCCCCPELGLRSCSTSGNHHRRAPWRAVPGVGWGGGWCRRGRRCGCGPCWHAPSRSAPVGDVLLVYHREARLPKAPPRKRPELHQVPLPLVRRPLLVTPAAPVHSQPAGTGGTRVAGRPRQPAPLAAPKATPLAPSAQGGARGWGGGGAGTCCLQGPLVSGGPPRAQ
jgi:hypothetical protein